LRDAELATALLRVIADETSNVGPTAADWERWRWYAQLQRVVPLLVELVARQAELEEAQERQLRAAQGDAMTWAVRLEHQLLRAADILDEQAIPYAVLKGLATAHLDYPAPEWRQIGDIDLLVAPDRFATTIELFERAGWVQGYALPRGHRRFTHAVTFIKDNIELDLHQHIAHRAIGLMVPTEELLTARRSYTIAGRSLWALSDTDRLIHGALHAQLSSGTTKRLSSVADVLVMSHRSPGIATAVIDRALGWSVAHLVAASISAAFSGADLPLPDSWRHSQGRIPEPRWTERIHLEQPQRPWALEAAYLSRLPTWHDRCLYIGGHVVGQEGGRGRGAVRARLRYLASKLIRPR
jgi:hypothetical protein